MREFLRTVWQVVSFPFRPLVWLASLPFRALARAARCMRQEPDEQPLPEAFSAILRQPGMLLVLAAGVVVCGS